MTRPLLMLLGDALHGLGLGFSALARLCHRWGDEAYFRVLGFYPGDFDDDDKR